MGPAARRYYLGRFSHSADPVKRIVASELAEGVFDLALPITTSSEEDPQAAIAAGEYSGKVIIVSSDPASTAHDAPLVLRWRSADAPARVRFGLEELLAAHPFTGSSS